MKEYLAGTAIKITAMLSDDPDSVTLTIYDPDKDELVSADSMTQAETDVYTYIYQTSATDDIGTYTIEIKAVKGIYTSKKPMLFRLLDSEED